MPSIVRVEPIGIDIVTEAGETVMTAAVRGGLRWPNICGGKGECGACRLVVVKGNLADTPLTPLEQLRQQLSRLAEPGELGPRLACQLVPNGDLVVRKAGVRETGETD